MKLQPTGLGAAELADPGESEKLTELAARVEADGGAVLARYREPLGGHALLLTALPIERVAPTPFQRDVSDAHVRKLTRAMDKTKRFLDPIIAIASEGMYWTPNGNHRLTAL
ncbi:MAG TPA: chromosome partitioning protein ParB, partial [Polyangiaceae bacterium]